MGSGLQRPPLDSEHNEVAKLGVGVETLKPRCMLEGEAGLTGASDRADAGGVDSKLSRMPKRQAVADDLYPAHVGQWGGEVRSSGGEVAQTARWSQARAACRCQPRRRCPGWLWTCACAGSGVSQAGTWQL